MTASRLPFRRLDLPLRGDNATSFLPWLVAPMIFLIVLAVSGAFTLHQLIARWDRDATGTLTVELPAAPGDAAPAAAQDKAWSDAAIHILNTTPGVLGARALTQDQLAGLLAPWLGGTDAARALPMPALIDVTVDPTATPDLNDLQSRLAAVIPGAAVDDHRLWLGRLTGLSQSLEWLGEAIVLLIGAATAAIVIHATRTGLAVHRETISVMHLIGATNDFIARQFAERMCLLVFVGGLIGLALAAPVLYLFQRWTHGITDGFLAGLALPRAAWITMGAVPPVAAALAMATARLTVHGTLSRRP